MGAANKAQIEKLYIDISEALKITDAFDATQIKLLTDLAKKEIRDIEGSWQSVIAADGQETAARLTAIAKDIRLNGEHPYYVAKVIAVWFASQKGEIADYVAANGIKAAVQKYCGIEFERELIQMIAQAHQSHPNLHTDSIEKVAFIKKAYRQGYHYEKVYRGCAQCHMAAVSDVTGKEDLTMFRAANGLAAGMGLLGDGVCGGYSGGILSLGLFAGRRKEFFDSDKSEKEMITKLVGKLHDKFMQTYDSVICHDIHKDIFGRAFHITESEEKVAFEEAGAHKKDKCPAVVGISAAWVAELLYDEGFLTGNNND